ncbi:MAG TPA: glucokinase [Alphaproteobacteria bacterium]|nr:hypothetical protein [Rhodospirillaceae bacterium]HRJ12796.1 glucokinase [Alphaproteobacteria bacterium]
MGNRLHIEFGGTNLRYEVLDSQFNIVASHGTSLAASGVSSLADFIDTQFMPGQVSNVLVATPSLAPDGTIPNSGALNFQVKLPDGHPLAATAEYLNDFAALAQAARDVSRLSLIDLNGKDEIPGNSIFYFIGPGTGLGTASAYRDARSGEWIISPSEVQHSFAPVSAQNLAVFREMAAIRDGEPIDPNSSPVLTYEQLCRGDALAEFAQIIFGEQGFDSVFSAADVILQASCGNIFHQRALQTWSQSLGVAAAALMKAHFHGDKDPVIILGGGVIPKIMHPTPEKRELANYAQTRDFTKNFTTPFREGLTLHKTGSAAIDAVFDNFFGKARVMVPSTRSPGLEGLRCYARRNNAVKFVAPSNPNDLPFC